MKPPADTPSRAAFSLVELLVVIAVIAIIASIAIPGLVNITRSADAATRVRNAQGVASTYNLYAEAYYAVNGAYPVITDIPTTISNIAAGQIVVNSRLDVTNFFRLPGLSVDNVEIDKLTVSNSQIAFQPEP